MSDPTLDAAFSTAVSIRQACRVSQVLAVAPKQIERHKQRLSSAKEQIAEFRFARTAQADDLAIHNDGAVLEFSK